MRLNTNYTMGRSLGMRLDTSYTMVYAMESVDCLCMSASRRQQLTWTETVTSCLSE